MKETEFENKCIKLQLLLQTPEVVPILRGRPGVAKTHISRTIAQHLGWGFYPHGLPGSDPTDLNGVQVMADDGLHQFPLKVLKDALESKAPFLLVIDEALSASETHMAAVQRVTDKGGYLGEFPIHGDFRMLLISNTSLTGTNMHALTLPAAGRFCHLLWTPADNESKLSYELARTMGDAAPPLKLLPPMSDSEWRTARQRATVLYATYTRSSHYIANECDDNSVPDTVAQRDPLCYASDRSWTTAIDVLATCIHHDRVDCYAELVNGIIGPSQGKQFLTSITDNDILDSDAILDGELTWTPNIRRADQIYAQILSLAMAVQKPRKNSQARLDLILTLMHTIITDYPGNKHLVLTGLRRILSKPPKGSFIQPNHAAWIRTEFEGFLS